MTQCARKAPVRSLLAFCLLFLSVGLQAAVAPGRAAVATAHPLATEAALRIMADGGNAFDAAVTASAVLGVVEPYSSGIGGGGFWLLHRARDGFQVMLDGRERAPLAAHRDMYLDAAGEPLPGASIDGPLAAGIPGQPAALVHLAGHYGRLPLARTLAPAIRIAREGFAVDAHYRRMAGMRLAALQDSAAAAATFLVDDALPEVGHRVRQPELADTLQRLADEGRPGFYAGEVARSLLTGVRAQGGIWSQADLDGYRVVERRPARLHVGDQLVTTAALPSSGGVVLGQMFNMLAARPVDGLADADRVHTLVEIMRRAYADRAHFLGDPDQVAVPVARLLDPVYARQRVADLDPGQATPSGPGRAARPKGTDTTHFSIIDATGNRVAATLSINYPFGSGFMVPGTGVLLNDEMDDFSLKPGVANVYGLVGNEANAIAPGKRMLSSMSPTFIENRDRVVILGTPGGSRIISMVFLAALAAMDGASATDLVGLPRFHHQYLPDRLQYEPGALDAALRAELERRGHTLQATGRAYGDMQVVVWDKRGGALSAASDPRRGGVARVAPPGAQQ